MPAFSPLDIVREATKAVPAVKYALGVAGVLAALSIAAAFFTSWAAAALGFLVMLILMILLYVFSIMVNIAGEAAKPPAIILLYSVVLLFVTWCVLLTSCTFIQQPSTLRELYRGILGAVELPARESIIPSSEIWLAPSGRFNVSSLPTTFWTPLPPGRDSSSTRAGLERRPKMVLDGTTLVFDTPSESRAGGLYASNIEFRNGSRIVTNGGQVELTSGLIQGSGEIISFEPGSITKPASPPGVPGVPGVPGAPGGSGGSVTIASGLAPTSALHILLPGQNGGAGGMGLNGSPGRAGARGSDGSDQLFGCGHSGSNGQSGEQGSIGAPGMPGGKGGDGGTLVLKDLISRQENQISLEALGGQGGAPGAGGIGGPGGQGGSGTVYCGGGRAGASGPQGLPGLAGVPGGSGSPGRKDIRS